jgi:DNA repair exonuclease SbcCD ATPase subunit
MLNKLYIKNFGPIKEINIDCKDKDVFIIGENGSGKTHILQAISLALSGKVAKNIKIGDFVGPHDKDFLIKIELNDGTKIERQKSKAKLTLKNGKTYDKVSDVYNYIPFDPELFYNLSYVKQGQISNFFEGDKSLMDKLINLLIDIKKIDNGYTIVTKTLNSKLKEIDSLENNKNEKPNIDKNVVEQEIKNLKNKLKPVDNKELNEQEQYHKKLDYLKNRKITVEEYLHNLKPVSKPKVDLNTAKHYMENSKLLENIIKKIDENQIKLNLYNEFKTEALEAYKKLLGINKKLVEMNFSESELEDISNKRNTVETYMTSEEYTSDSEEFKNLIEFVKKQWDIDSNNIMKAKKAWEECTTIIRSNSDRKDVIRDLKANSATPENIDSVMNDMIKSKEEELASLNKQKEDINITETMDISNYSELSSSWSSYDNYIESKKDYEDQIEKVKTDISSIESKITKTMDEITELKNLASQNEIVKTNIKDKESLIEMYNYWIKQETQRINQIKELEKDSDYLTEIKECLKILPTGIRNTLFEPVADIVNEDFFEIFSFSNLGKISIDWDKVQLNIGDLSFEQMSGAQSCTLALSLRLALLKRMGAYIPLMLIDEPTNHLDDKRISDLMKYFSMLHNQTQMFVSTHNDDIIPAINTITININDYK